MILLLKFVSIFKGLVFKYPSFLSFDLTIMFLPGLIILYSFIINPQKKPTTWLWMIRGGYLKGDNPQYNQYIILWILTQNRHLKMPLQN